VGSLGVVLTCGHPAKQNAVRGGKLRLRRWFRANRSARLCGLNQKCRQLCNRLRGNKMSRIGTAFRAFFAALQSVQKAEAIRAALEAPSLPKSNLEAKPQPTQKTPEPPRPARSEAITLLATLQREARLIDLIQEPLDTFSDEQIGGAARNVLRDAAGVVDRFFALQPVLSQEEGASVDVPPGYDPAKFKLAGNIGGTGPFRGTLDHKGWRATICNLPAWTGSKDAALIIAPAEVEV